MRNPRPYLKWAGGKGKLLEELLYQAPPTFGDYWEPFVGGGALFFALRRTGRLNKSRPGAHLWDISEELMGTWKVVKSKVEPLIRWLKRRKYDNEEFYRIRAWDRNPDWLDKYSDVQRAGRMIYLNKTCYNGLYRVNGSGQFNAPFGRYKTPLICDSENLRAVSAALRGVKFQSRDFEYVAIRGAAKAGDFVYLDPPYVPQSDTANFTSYTAGGFSMDDHERLAKLFDRLANRGVQVVLSNSDTPWVRARYQEHRLIRVMGNRNINSKSKKRGPVSELIIVPR